MRKYSSVNRSYGSSGRRPEPTTRRRPVNSGGAQGRPHNSGQGQGRRPSKRNTVVLSKQTKIIMASAIAAVAVVLVCFFCGVFNAEPKLEGIIAQNVTIEGVSVGGMDANQAKTALSSKTAELTSGAEITIEVPAGDILQPDSADTASDAEASDSEDQTSEEIPTTEIPTTDLSATEETATSSDAETTPVLNGNMQQIKYPSERSAIYADVDAAIALALEYSKSVEDKSEKEMAEMPIENIVMPYAIDADKLSANLTQDAENWNIEATPASFGLETSSDPERKTTTAVPAVIEAQDGVSVDVPAFAALIQERVTAQNLTELIVSPTVITQPEATTVDISQYEVIGAYDTSFASSNGAGRVHNIWKISEFLNGTKVLPEETMSVNDIVGPRTDPDVWALASGIENGQFTDQLGGGICQVSTTLYIAALKAEMKIASRTHHTIPSTYVPLGLDATISTDWPDLQLTNNTEYPMFIGINCDVPNDKVEVKIYGIKPRDYYLRFESKTIETIPAPETVYVADSSVPEGTTVEEGSKRDGYVVEVYKVWYDKETEKETDRARIYTDTYKPIGLKVKYNPLTPPQEVLDQQNKDNESNNGTGENTGGENTGGEGTGGEGTGENTGGEGSGGTGSGGEGSGGTGSGTDTGNGNEQPL